MPLDENISIMESPNTTQSTIRMGTYASHQTVVTLAVFMVVGLILNALLTFTLIRNARLYYLRNALLLNLTVSDMLNCLSTLLLLMIDSFSRRHPDVNGCVLYNFLSLLFGSVNVNTMALDSIRR